MTTLADQLLRAASARLDGQLAAALAEALDGADDANVRLLLDALTAAPSDKGAAAGLAEARRRFGPKGAA